MDLLELNRNLILSALKETIPLSGGIIVPCKLHIFSRNISKRDHLIVFGCEARELQPQLRKCFTSILAKTDRKISQEHDVSTHVFNRAGINPLNNELWGLAPGAAYIMSGGKTVENTEWIRNRFLPTEDYVFFVLRFSSIKNELY